MTIRIAVLQLLPERTAEGNLAKGVEACRRAKKQGADIALFPEMWSCGYTIPGDLAALKSLAVPADGAFAGAFRRLAAELDMAIAVSFLERHEPLPRNSVSLFDRRGNLRYTYAKVHTCDFGDERHLCAGDDFFVAELDTAKGGLKVGSMICYDREFPESARILMLKGAELILVPNACPLELYRLAELRTRSYENMVAVATANYAEGKPDCNGHSVVFDGVAYRREEAGTRDMKVFEAGGAEGVYTADIDMDALRDFRRKEVHGNAYRRPEKYGLLLDRRVEAPFFRSDKKNI